MEVAQQVIGAVQAQVVVSVLHGNVAVDQQGRWFALADRLSLPLVAQSQTPLAPFLR